jgi:hypothetical protein
MAISAPTSAVDDSPPIITICGDAGTGKTSLAATFPKPVFIRAEDGLKSLPRDKRPDAFPLLSSVEELREQLMWLLKEKHNYKTVVIDSVSALETLFVKDVMERDGRAKSINQALGGYGAGWSAVAANHAMVRKAAEALNKRRGVAVVFISHADLETMRLPDADDYSRYSLRLNGKSLPPYVDDVDLVGFVRLVSALRGDDGDRKKIISNGDREVICHATAASVSKNRYGITDPLDCPAGVNPFLAAPAFAEALGVKPKGRKATPAPSQDDDDGGDDAANTQNQDANADVDPADFEGE